MMLTRVLLLSPIAALMLAGVAGADPGNTARAGMSVSVQVVRSCTVQPSGKSATVDCGSTVPATMRIGVARPAPQSTTTGGPTGPQVVTIEF